MNTTLDIGYHEGLETGRKSRGRVARWLEALRDMRDRRAARRELSRMPAHLLADIGIDSERVDDLAEAMVAARRTARIDA